MTDFLSSSDVSREIFNPAGVRVGAYVPRYFNGQRKDVFVAEGEKTAPNTPSHESRHPFSDAGPVVS